jgi:hypothetical protein
VDWPVAASVASGWNSTGLASTAAKSIGNVVWYSSSISARMSATGRPRSKAERRMKARAYAGSVQPRSPCGRLSSHAPVMAPADAP